MRRILLVSMLLQAVMVYGQMPDPAQYTQEVFAEQINKVDEMIHEHGELVAQGNETAISYLTTYVMLIHSLFDVGVNRGFMTEDMRKNQIKVISDYQAECLRKFGEAKGR